MPDATCLVDLSYSDGYLSGGDFLLAFFFSNMLCILMHLISVMLLFCLQLGSASRYFCYDKPDGRDLCFLLRNYISY